MKTTTKKFNLNTESAEIQWFKTEKSFGNIIQPDKRCMNNACMQLECHVSMTDGAANSKIGFIVDPLCSFDPFNPTKPTSRLNELDMLIKGWTKMAEVYVGRKQRRYRVYAKAFAIPG